MTSCVYYIVEISARLTFREEASSLWENVCCCGFSLRGRCCCFCFLEEAFATFSSTVTLSSSLIMKTRHKKASLTHKNKPIWNIVILVTRNQHQNFMLMAGVQERHTYPVHWCLSSVRSARIIRLSVCQRQRPLTQRAHLSVAIVQRSLQTPSWRDLCHVITPETSKQTRRLAADLSFSLFCNSSRT